MTVTEIIDEILPGESQDAPVVERAQFRVTDESSACWVLRRLAAIEAEAALVKAQAARRVEELAVDRSRLLSRFSAELEAWAREEAQRRRRRSVTLLWGTLAFRCVPARLEVCGPCGGLDHFHDGAAHLQREVVVGVHQFARVGVRKTFCVTFWKEPSGQKCIIDHFLDTVFVLIVGCQSSSDCYNCRPLCS